MNIIIALDGLYNEQIQETGFGTIALILHFYKF